MSYKLFELQLNTKFESRARVLIDIKLQNNAHKDYYLSSDVIFQDGITSDKIEISGPSNIKCKIYNMNYQPEYISIKSHSMINSTINLSDICDFTDAKSGHYIIKFSTLVVPCGLPNYEDCDVDLVMQAVGELNIQELGQNLF